MRELPIDEDLLLFAPGDRRVHLLNGTARQIWEMLAQGIARETLLGVLPRKSPDPQRTRAALLQLFRTWDAQGLFPETEGRSSSVPYSTDRQPSVPRPQPADCRTAGRDYVIADRCIRIYAPPHFIEALAPLVGHLATDGNPGRTQRFLWVREATEGGYVLESSFDGPHRSADREEALMHALGAIVELACDATRRLLVLHAGGLCRGDRGIVLAGPGGCGKSTLTALLARRGLTYLGDDVLPVDRETGALYGVPVACGLKTGSWPVLRPFFPSIETLPLYRRLGRPTRFLVPSERCSNGPVRAALLLFPRWSPKHPSELRPLSRAQALARLIASESVFGVRGNDLPRVADWLRACRAYHLTYSAIEEAAAWVEGLLEES